MVCDRRSDADDADTAEDADDAGGAGDADTAMPNLYLYAYRNRKADVSSRFFTALGLKELLFDLECGLAEAAITRVQKPGVKTALMLDCADTMGGDAQ